MSKTRQWGVALALWAGTLGASAAASASDEDPWLGRDKALHFGASAVLAGGGYAVGTGLWPERWKSFALGGGVALAAGAAKEGLDAMGLGTPSWRDFTWDVAGTVVGLGIAYAIDAVVRSAPATSGPTVAPGPRSGVAIWRF